MQSDVNRISAADNLSIEMTPEHWRLVAGNMGIEEELFSARTGEDIHYAESFAASHQLPMNGVLPVNYVWQVVLGWSSQDESWHLGLLLGRDLAEARGSRWCALAGWPDPDPTVFADLAQRAGNALAQVIGVRFYTVPVQQKEAQPPPLPELPIEAGVWTLEPLDANRIQFVRSRRWINARLSRVAWYLFWTVVYLVLSITTLNTDLALPNSGTMLPNPELLPYLGIGAAVVLIGMVLYMLWELMTSANRIVIDGIQHRVIGFKGQRERWSRPADEVESVYVTEVINEKRDRRIINHGELNLHLRDGDFLRMIQQPEKTEEIVRSNGNAPISDTVQTLVPAEHLSDLQGIGLYVAQTLGGLPCWYDHRTRG